jgi:hypothetical protein
MSTPAQTSIVQNAAVNPNMSTIDLTRKLDLTAGSQPAAGMFDNYATGFKNARAGAEGLFTTEGRNAFLGNSASKGVEATGIGGLKGLGMSGFAALTPMLMDTTTTKQPDLKTDANMGQRYQYKTGAQTPTPTPDVPGYDNQGENFGKEKLYFTPSYTSIDDETAKRMYGHASGGPVEDMSNANAIGMNTGYPQAAIDTGAYATPYQQPISRNVVTGLQGAGMNPYTGQAQFAEGGEVDEYTYDPVTQLYTKRGGQGATTVKPIKSISETREGGGGGRELGSTINNPGGVNTKDSLVNSFLSSAMVGRVGNFFGSKQDPKDVTVEDREGTPTPAFDMGAPNAGPDARDAQGTLGMGDARSGGGRDADGTPYAKGGISHLGDYSDGGRLLRGPGDGISDSIPAMIGKKQPARLADGEFVVPARIVSELGNGSTEAGARKLYAMMDRVQKARGKTVGKGRIAANSRSAKYLPA